MPREYEQENISGIESEALNPVLIAQIASRLFNEVPEAGSVPRYETDAAGAPSSAAGSLQDKTVLAGEPGALNIPTALQQQDFYGESASPYGFDALPAEPEHDFYFLPGTPEKKQEPLGHHANKLTEQQNYSENTDGSYGSYKQIFVNPPESPKGTLMWEFGKRISSLMGKQRDLDAVMRFSITEPHTFITTTLTLRSVLENCERDKNK